MKKYLMLDFFSGLGGASSAMREDNRWTVITVDNVQKFNPTICKDVLSLKPEHFSGMEIDLIWASPPCVAFSMASVSHYWRKVKGCFLPRNEKTIEYLNLVFHTLWIVNELQPTWWFLENPRGILHKFIGRPSGWVTYCQYGEKRMKPTNLWGQHPPSFQYMHCRYQSKCHSPTPRGSSQGTQGLGSPEKAAKIPYLLSKSVKESIEKPGGEKSSLDLFF